ncbi:MAG TPA: hypothetical protein VHX43_03110 [Xanthobacteraceae bacterium]|jgi:hypothetical protein|nr:hypothetical protein [Xanthobacteraceae bacterium]
MTHAVRVKLAADDILDMTLVAPEHGNARHGHGRRDAEGFARPARHGQGIVLTAEGADFCAERRHETTP